MLPEGQVQSDYIGIVAFSNTIPNNNSSYFFKYNCNNNSSSIRRCLFGKSDKRDTEKLIEEEFKNDREKMLLKYGFDTLTDKFIVDSGNTELANNKLRECNVNAQFNYVLRDSQHKEDVQNEYNEQVRFFDERKPLGEVCNTNTLNIHKNMQAVMNDKSRKLNKPYDKQLQITDFWRTRKINSIKTTSSKKKNGGNSNNQ